MLTTAHVESMLKEHQEKTQKINLIVDFFKKCMLKNDKITSALLVVLDGENGIFLETPKSEVTTAKQEIMLKLNPSRWQQFADLYDDQFKNANGSIEAKKLQAELTELLNGNTGVGSILQQTLVELWKLPQVEAIMRAIIEKNNKPRLQKMQENLQADYARNARMEAECEELKLRFEAQRAADAKGPQSVPLKLAPPVVVPQLKLAPVPNKPVALPPVPLQFSTSLHGNGVDLGISSVKRRPFTRNVELIFTQGHYNMGNPEAAKQCEQHLQNFGIKPVYRGYNTVELTDENYQVLRANGVKNCNPV